MQQSAPNMYENDKNDSYAVIHQFMPFLNCLSNQFQWTDAGWELDAPRPSLSKNKMPSLDRTGWNPHKWCDHSFFFWWLFLEEFKAFLFLTYSLTVFQGIQI